MVMILEALHDMARPVDVLAAALEAVAADGVVLIADEAVAPEFTAPGDEIERMMYGWCLPAAMAEQPSAAIGTVIRGFAPWPPSRGSRRRTCSMWAAGSSAFMP
ncbi:MAG: hypothetical protein ACRD12_24330 [Acidimicrobiales bacterium]